MRYKHCLLNVVKSTSALSVVCLRHWLVARAVVVVVEEGMACLSGFQVGVFGCVLSWKAEVPPSP
jgi:hypothetical protein